LRGEKVLTGVEGLQVSFVADVADEVGESLLLDAPQDAAHHRRHGYRRHAGEGVRWKLLVAYASPSLFGSVRPAGQARPGRLVAGSVLYVGWALKKSGL
jgi:hypothetical protein